jgi:hypothetical protein
MIKIEARVSAISSLLEAKKKIRSTLCGTI